MRHNVFNRDIDIDKKTIHFGLIEGYLEVNDDKSRFLSGDAAYFGSREVVEMQDGGERTILMDSKHFRSYNEIQEYLDSKCFV